MYARLGFSVAAHTDPDILVVDEVLAVGDGPFQRKCYDFMHQFIKRDRTVVFVSHNMPVIEQLCTHVLWIDRGQMKLLGPPRQVLPAYFDAMDRQILEARTNDRASGQQISLSGLRITDAHGADREAFATGDDVVVRLEYRTVEPVQRPHFCVAITGPEGGAPLIMASMLLDGQAPEEITGIGTISCRFRALPLQPRAYQLWGEVWDANQSTHLVPWQRLGGFRVAMAADDMLRLGKGGLRHMRVDAPIRVSYDWDMASSRELEMQSLGVAK
jgi:hypothetical protein